jgi:hypothetical protein
MRRTASGSASVSRVGDFIRMSSPTDARESERVGALNMRTQSKRCAAYIHRTYVFAESSSEESGVALQAGLLASLKPHKRVFPLAGCHP